MEKKLLEVMDGNHDYNYKYKDYVNVLMSIGYTKKAAKTGSHEKFFKDGMAVIMVAKHGKYVEFYNVRELRAACKASGLF